MLDEHTDANLTIEADKEQNDDDSENKIKDQASCLRDLLSTSVASPSILQHTQRLLKKTTGGKGTSDTIEKDALLKYLYEHFGLENFSIILEFAAISRRRALNFRIIFN